MVGFCDCCNECLGSKKSENSFDQLSNYKLFKKGPHHGISFLEALSSSYLLQVIV
jgi:hypothetical protein